MFSYVYQYKDHLGNVRLSYSDSNNSGDIDPTTEIISEKNYYPFGLQQQGYNNTISGNANAVGENFGFGGKENNPELGIEWMDFGARNYDAALGRWMNVDPLAELMRRHSPYNYAFNNPIYFIDPDGMSPLSSIEEPPTKFVTENGETIADTDDGSDEVFVIREENETAFKEKIQENVDTKEDLDAEKNKELGEELGYNLKDIKSEAHPGAHPTLDTELNDGFELGYNAGFKDPEERTFKEKTLSIILMAGDSKLARGESKGRNYGNQDRKEGKMSMFSPELKNNNPSIETNERSRTNVTPNYNFDINGNSVITVFPTNF